MIIPNINTIEYNYNLDDDKIAKYPLEHRDTSKLLIYNQEIFQDNFYNIDRYIPENSLLIINNTKVIQARIFFKKETGAKIEIFCLEPYQPYDYNSSFNSTENCSWKCLVGNSKKWKNEILKQKISFNKKNIELSAEKIINNGDNIIKFSWNSQIISFSEILEKVGQIPIPPYLNRKTEESDKNTYQTFYSKIEGSVAAPTAGLHFTENVFSKINNKKTLIKELTLHVGAGTFKPITEKEIKNHEMHGEFYSVSKDLIKAIYNNKGKLISSGTTSSRTIESLYWIAAKIENNVLSPEIINQWDPYNLNFLKSSKEAIEILLNYMEQKNLKTLNGITKMIIVPGYKFRFIDAIITNFHQPNSTLLLLIAALVGDEWKNIYKFALNNNFRFLSYGDSSILFRKNN